MIEQHLKIAALLLLIKGQFLKQIPLFIKIMFLCQLKFVGVFLFLYNPSPCANQIFF